MIILDIVLYIILILIVIGLCYIIYLFVYDYVVYKTDNDNKLNSTSSLLDKNIKSLDKNISSINDDYFKKINDIQSNYNYLIKSNSDNISGNLSNLSSNDNRISQNLSSFDSNLKNYFSFSGNVLPTGSTDSANIALYNYVFDRASLINHYNLQILKNAVAVSGMTIKTNPSLSDTNNFRICGNSTTENCINLNVNDSTGVFNITPENNTVNKIKMNNYNGKSLATFDFANNSIRLGESQTAGDNNTALYIKDNDVYIKSLKLLNPGYNYAAPIASTDYISLDNNTLLTLVKSNNVVICSYQLTQGSPSSMVLTIIPKVNINAGPSSMNYIYINIPEISSTSGSTLSITDTTLTISAATFISSYSKSDNVTLSYIKLTVIKPMYSNSKTSVTITSGFSIVGGVSLSNIAVGYIDNS